eukprot:gnl/TRDRNA2_/TRDRNA2_186232_c0_seq1.p1 gnl/TRDRNA2_/TRDRNA2_186232_c0~~gnl/TRDRNA2_/TRDRNA2_186232_c0_seq1.p1  ORF type:complete len:196 (-),score=41.41 gnl/TRDRNA2_/TRDRNA2_186232_c0_seq1:121-708(-)
MARSMLVVALALLFAGNASAQPLSSRDKAAVGNALNGAIAVLSGKAAAGSKWSSCNGLFPRGRPEAGDSQAVWNSCKDVLSGVKRGSLLAKKAQQQLTVQGPITADEKAQVAKALGEALSTMSAAPGTASGSKYDSCAALFPNGQPADTSSPMWTSCKSVLFYNLLQRAQKVVQTATRDKATAIVQQASIELSWM